MDGGPLWGESKRKRLESARTFDCALVTDSPVAGFSCYLVRMPVAARADETYITESYLRRKIECNTLAHLMGDIMADLLGGGWFNHPDCDDWHSQGQIKVIIDSS